MTPCGCGECGGFLPILSLWSLCPALRHSHPVRSPLLFYEFQRGSANARLCAWRPGNKSHLLLQSLSSPVHLKKKISSNTTSPERKES